MKKIVQNEKYGKITYTESFWTGRPSLEINDAPLTKTGKRTFEYAHDETTERVELKGNFMTGVKLLIGDEVIVVEKSARWYEYVFAALILVFNLVWGNVVALVKLMPIVGGAIGGAVCGCMMAICMLLMRKVDKFYLKFIIFIVCFGLSILICYLLALVVLSAIS